MSVYVSIGLAGVSTSVAAGLVLHRWLRPKFPVTVNCWFCNRNTKVPFGNKNCWDCPHCEQYNGFSENGDYNKPIPAQHEEFFNETINQNRSRESFDKSFKNGFCSECNANQHMKIAGLAHFVPLNEENYDNELNEYKTYLERVYRLCRKCELVLQGTLGEQDAFLRPKLLDWRSKRNNCSSSSKSSIFESAFIKKVYTSSTFCSYFYLLSFVLFLSAIIVNVFKNELIEYNEKQLWTQIILPPHILNIIVELFNQSGYQISLVAFVLGIIFSKFNVYFMDLVTLLMHLAHLIINSQFVSDGFYVNYKINKQIVKNIFLYSNLILLLYVSVIRCFPRKIEKYISKSTIASRSRDTSTNAWMENKLRAERKQRKKNKGNLQTSLGAMSLGSPRKSNKNQGVFTTHEYAPSNSTPGLHYLSEEIRSRRPVLSPPRFASPQPYFANYWQQPHTVWSPSVNNRISSAPSFTNLSQFHENGNLYSPLPTNNSFYCPSYASSRVGSVYGCDEQSFYDHQCHNFNCVSQQDVSQSYENNINGKRCSDKATNSSKSSTSTCPVDTTSNLTLSENGKETCFYSWQYAVLILSVILNVVAAIFVLKDSKFKFVVT